MEVGFKVFGIPTSPNVEAEAGIEIEAAGELDTSLIVGAAKFPKGSDDATLATGDGLTAAVELNKVEPPPEVDNKPLELATPAAGTSVSSEATVSIGNPWLAAFSACSRANCKAQRQVSRYTNPKENDS